VRNQEGGAVEGKPCEAPGKNFSRRQLALPAARLSSNAEPRPLVPLRFELVCTVCRFSQCCFTASMRLIGLLTSQTCFEWKAGPPSSLPFAALVLHPAVCSEQKRFQNPTVELLEPSADRAMTVPAPASERHCAANLLFPFSISRRRLRNNFQFHLTRRVVKVTKFGRGL
jgi:hypothetical protein